MLKRYVIFAQVEDDKSEILEERGIFEDILERTMEKAASDLNLKKVVVLYPRREGISERAFHAESNK